VSENLIRYVEHLSDVRTMLGETRVSDFGELSRAARGGWAGEKTDVFNSLLERSGWSKLCREPAIRIERTTSGLVIRVFGGFTAVRELMRERDHLPDLFF
jgi:hypothetical protein